MVKIGFGRFCHAPTVKTGFCQKNRTLIETELKPIYFSDFDNTASSGTHEY